MAPPKKGGVREHRLWTQSTFLDHPLLIKSGDSKVASVAMAVCVAHSGTGNDGIYASYRVRYAMHGPILGSSVDAPHLSPRS